NGSVPDVTATVALLTRRLPPSYHRRSGRPPGEGAFVRVSGRAASRETLDRGRAAVVIEQVQDGLLEAVTAAFIRTLRPTPPSSLAYSSLPIRNRPTSSRRMAHARTRG